MILDLQAMFSGSVASDGTKTGQALTATAISANVMDLTNGAGTPATQDLGLNSPEFWLVVGTDNSADFASAGATTLDISLESDTAVGLATVPVVHARSANIAKATMVKNTVLWRTQLPSDTYKRYLGLRYTVNVANFSAGGILAFLTPDLQRNVIYGAGFTIDV